MADNGFQLELFRPSHQVEVLDPRRVIGRHTRVQALYRVRYGGLRGVHQVYRDQHGWYCGEHGPRCAAVVDAVAAAEARARRRSRARPGGTAGPAAGGTPSDASVPSSVRRAR